MAGVLGSALACRQRWPNQRELSRKIVHIGTGPVLPLAWFLQVPASIAVPCAVVVTLIAFINHRWNLLPAVEDVGRNSYGTVAYGFAICLLLILFWADNPAAACAGVLVMAFGDGLAGLIGRAVRSPNWTLLDQRKSIVGTTTMAITSAVVLARFSADHPKSTHPTAALSGLHVGCGARTTEPLGHRQPDRPPWSGLELDLDDGLIKSNKSGA